MRVFVLTIILAVFVSLAATPAYSQDANAELTADLQEWLVGRWLCEYSRSMKAEAIYGADKEFLWIFSIGRVPYATVIRQMGTYDIVVPGDEGHQATIMATIQGTLPEDPEFVPGALEQADITRTGADTLQDSSGECVRKE